jgi:hypothetical protein
LPERVPQEAFTLRLVLELQREVSDLLPPTVDDTVASSTPMFDPTTVTLIAPVVPMFVGSAPVIAGPSYVMPAVNVPSASVAVTDNRRATAKPETTRKPTAVVECHTVASNDDEPMLTRAVVSLSDTVDPNTVTLWLPVEAMFVRTTVLGPGATYVKCKVMLPACSPAVETIARPDRIPPLDLTTKPLSDRQAVTSVPLPPMRPQPLYSHWPMPPSPTTVTC